MAGAYIGIDIGTTGCRTIVVDPKGAMLAAASSNYPNDHPKPGWSEQDPEHWWRATVETVRKALNAARVKASVVGAIGLSGQMHGSVFLDAKDNVLRPAILWNDQRTAAECEEIERLAGGRRELIRMVANPALTGFTAPKILWLRRHEPKRFERVRRVLLPKDYVRLKLTGEYATEVSDASGTLLFDVARRRWSTELLGRLDLDPDLLPACFESQEVSGGLSASAADLLDLEEGTDVVGGGGDQAAGAVGNGIVAAGAVSATLGTSGVVFAHSDQLATEPTGSLHAFCHAVPGKWHLMGVVLSAGGSFQWYRDQLAQDLVREAREQQVDPYELLTALAAEAPAGSEGLYFLPYLTGERTPHADPFARGAWIGLSPRHGRAHLVRSLLEGVTYAMRDSLELIRRLGVPVEEIRISGGGAQSRFWRELQASIYGQPVATINATEGPAYGAAILAAVGAREFQSVPEACRRWIKVVGRTRPDKKAAAAYDRFFPEFGRLYQALRPEFPRLQG